MKYKYLLTMLILSCAGAAFFGISSCKDDDDGGSSCSVAWATETQDEINALSAAAQAYGLNPSTANCNAYKDAVQDYLDALKSYENCSLLSPQERNDLEDAIDTAEAQNSAIVC